jgi:hypothetical protein
VKRIRNYGLRFDSKTYPALSLICNSLLDFISTHFLGIKSQFKVGYVYIGYLKLAWTAEEGRMQWE